MSKDTSFAELFEATQSQSGDFSVGSVIHGEVISIGAEEIFLSIGSHLDGILPKVGLSEAVEVGDHVAVQIVRVDENSILLREKNSSVGQEVESLEDAFDMEIPIEGLVTEAVKGGLKVKVLGVSAFCPISQVDAKRIEDTAPYIGKKYEFIVTQYESRNVVVSRRKVLELKRAEVEGQLLENLKSGDIVDAEVTRIESYGVFASIQGHVEGLIHISELSWSRVKSPHDVVGLGNKVSVKVLSVEELDDRLKISLSMKQAGENDPWSEIEKFFKVGDVVDAYVEKKAAFGLFIDLGKGITGLLPKSMWRESAEAKTYENMKAGTQIRIRVHQIQQQDRKITLALPESGDEDQSWREHISDQPQESSMGTFADLFKKK